MIKNFSLTRSRMWRTRAATALAAVGALVMSGGLVMLGASTAAAEGQDHVFVCKYVGKPGVDEELKDGKQPIYVAVSAIQQNQWDHVTVPAYFSDAQDRSYVLDWATKTNTGQGQTYIGTKTCPAPDHPTIIPVPGQPNTTDPCGPRNISFIVPQDTTSLDWELLPNGNVTVTPKAGYRFDQENQLVTFILPADSNVPCDGTVTIAPPGAPSTTDPCGPANISFNVPADTTQLDYTLLGNGNVTVAPKPGYVFSGNSQLITFTLPADSNVPCDSTVTIAPPGAPSTTDPCGPANISFNVPADTTQLDYTLLGNGNVNVAPKPGYVFSGNSQLITFTLPADSGVPCPLGVEEISPTVSFTEPTCKNLDGAKWSGNLKSIVDYTIEGTPGLGQTVTVTATIKPSMADQFAFPAGFDNTFDHTYVTEAELACPTVKGSESSKPKPQQPPQTQPTVLGTQAVAPTAVNAGLTGLPATGSSSNRLLAQLLVGGGLVLLLAGGWLGFGRREYGAHQA